MSPGTNMLNLGTQPSGGRLRVTPRGFVLALGAVLALAPPSFAQQPSMPTPLDGYQLAELSLSEGHQIDLELPDRLLAPFEMPLVVEGQSFTLLLEPHSVRASGFRVLVPGPDGQLATTDAPAPRTLRGRVLGLPGSLAGGSLVDGRLQLMLRLAPDAPLWAVEPLSNGSHALYAQTAVVGSGGMCGTVAPPPRGPQVLPGLDAGDELQEAEIALDADYEYYQKAANSVDNVVVDLENIIELTRLIYASSVGISYKIKSILVRSNANDPYTTSDAGQLLGQFRSTWNQPPLSNEIRDVAHLFTGKAMIGSVIGVAYLNAICNLNLAYGLSESKFSPGIILRVALTAHELGHNWASPHCDGSPDCAIMCSAIASCPGGSETFGATAVAAITQKRDSSTCLTTVIEPGLPTLNTVFPAFGRSGGGGVIELHGEHLPTANVPTVTMGGIDVDVLSASETLVTVVVPPGTPGVSVDVTLTDGKTLTVIQSGYRYELEMALGDKVTSELALTEVERFFFDGLAGARVSVKLKPTNSLEGLVAGLRLIGPGEQNLVTVGGGVSGGSVAIKKAVLPATGEYRIEAFAIGVTKGSYQVKTKGKPPKLVKANLTVSAAQPNPALVFGADAGSLLKLALFKRISPKGNFALVDGEPADLAPTLISLTGPEGPIAMGDLLTHSPKGTWARVKLIELPVYGEYTLLFGGLDGSIGHGKARAKVKPLKRKPVSYVLDP